MFRAPRAAHGIGGFAALRARFIPVIYSAARPRHRDTQAAIESHPHARRFAGGTGRLNPGRRPAGRFSGRIASRNTGNSLQDIANARLRGGG